jgi:PAS domain S-box-containing protein
MSALNSTDYRERAVLLDLLLSATQDGIVDWNLQSGETVYNPRWKHLFGFDSADLREYHETPNGWRDLIHPDDRAHALRLIDDHVQQGWPLYTTVRMRHRHTSYKHILVRGAAHRDEHDRALRLVLVFSDVDERIREEQLRRAELVQAQKLGAIGQLASGVAHEINTPLQFVGDSLHFAKTAVADVLALLEQLRRAAGSAKHAPADPQVLAELAQTEADLDYDYVRDALPSAIDRSLAGVERVSRIVRALKTFAHPDKEQLTPTDLRGLIESTVVVATNEWKYVAEVELQLAPDLPLVPCLGGELNQVVLNLIVNAAHAIGDVVGNSGEKGRIVVSASADDTYAFIRVSDTGTGITDEAKPKVFDPFFTTKEVGKGTGQGLAMAYNCIVEKHKGSIDFESELGVGTTFTIRLLLRHAESGDTST